VQGALVALEAWHVVAALGANLGGDGILTAHGINRDDAALQFQ